MDSIHFVHSWYKQQFDKVKVPSPDQMAHTIDEHIWLVKFLPYVLGAAGVVISLKAIRTTSKFTSARQIPRAFVRKNAELRGRIVSVNMDGTIALEHFPIVNLPWHNVNKPQYLEAKFAFLRPNISGIYWLKLNVLDKPVHFRIIDRRENELIVALRTSIKPKLHLNDELISRGLATLHSQSDLKSRVPRKLFHRLEKLEQKAQKSGVGIWEINYKPSVFTNLVNNLSQLLKKVITRK